MIRHWSAAWLAGVVLFGCAPVEPAALQASAAFTPSGQVQTLQAEADDDTLQWAASVVRVDVVPNQQDGFAKMFGAAGGDPAMNGLYTYVAFFRGPAEGWRVFRIGDFLDYRIVAAAPGQIDLEIRESVMDPQTSDIGARTRRLIVSWDASARDAPATIEVAPAR